MENALTNATSQTNFTDWDWGIVAVYLLLSVAVAFFVKRYASNMTNFVGAGRAVGPWLGIATLTGTEMGLITVMYSAQKGFTGGFAAFHIGVIAGVVAFIIGVTGFIVVRLREHKVLTIPEFYEKRFGRRTRILGGVMLAFGGLLNMGLFLKVGSMFIVGITGMNPDGNTLKLVMVGLLVLVLVYTVIGGMISVIITDYIQFVILSIGILAAGWLAIFGENGVGWNNLFDTVQIQFEKDSGFNPLSEDSAFGVEYVVWMGFLGIVNCALWPTAVARALAMESTAAVRKQFTWASVSFAIRMIIPNLLGICAFVFVVTKAPDLNEIFSPTDPDNAQLDNIYAMPVFLGRILPAGLIGLLTAAMIAAFMSTHDGYLLCWSTVITQDIIAPLFKGRLDNPTRVRITRILIVLIGLYILYWGLVYTGEDDIWDYMAVTGAIYFTGAFSLLVGGLYWQRASSKGAVLGLLAGCTAVLGLDRVQQEIYPYTPGYIEARPITDVYEGSNNSTVIEFDAFEELPGSDDDSFLQYIDPLAVFKAEPWISNQLKNWKAAVRRSNGELHRVKIERSYDDRIRTKELSKFDLQPEDTIAFYNFTSERVGLFTITFSMLMFILGSLLFPDRKPTEATDE
ncbi:MAG: hypothetical protein CMO63_04065 [Verrucomicrobiales bacterium]|nr:hypothetical protein [Verrucomicrobiales bacterium]